VWLGEEDIVQKLRDYVARSYRDSFCQPDCLDWTPPMEVALAHGETEEGNGAAGAAGAAASNGNGHSHGLVGANGANGGDASPVVAESNNSRRKVSNASPRYAHVYSISMCTAHHVYSISCVSHVMFVSCHVCHLSRVSCVSRLVCRGLFLVSCCRLLCVVSSVSCAQK
jgi:hypothetical protein